MCTARLLLSTAQFHRYFTTALLSQHLASASKQRKTNPQTTQLWYQVKTEQIEKQSSELRKQIGKPLHYGEYLDPLLLTEELRKRLK